MSKHWKAPPKKGKRAMFREIEQREAETMPPQEKDDPEKDPQKTVREARARQTGKPESEVLRPIFVEDSGRAIEAEAENRTEAAKLWETFQAFDMAENTYFARVIGRPRFPNVSKLEFMPERFETRPDDRPDLRSEDEKHRDAVNNWMRWQGYLGCLQGHERSALIRASWKMDELHRGCAVTVHGQQFVKALRMLRGVVEGRG